MGVGKSVVAIIGSYRKGGIVDALVDEVLESVREAGARISRVYLADGRPVTMPGAG
jgi:multimeric flavodoxin WrbA